MTGGLLIAMVSKRFPDDYKPFLVVITQSEKHQTFSKFIVALQGFQDTEGANTAAGDDSIMKARNNHPKSNQNAKETKNGITPVTNVANQVISNASVREKKAKTRHLCSSCRSKSHSDRTRRRMATE